MPASRGSLADAAAATGGGDRRGWPQQAGPAGDDGVDDQVGARGERDHRRDAQPARGVGAVAEDQHQRRAIVAVREQDRRPGGVDERGRAARVGGLEGAGHRRVIGGQRRVDGDAAGEGDDGGAIVRPQVAHQRRRGVAQRLQPRAGDAAAGVEHQHDVDVDVLDAGGRDLLLDAVVEQLEVVGGELADRLAALGDERVDADDVGDGAEERRRLRRRLLLRVGAGSPRRSTRAAPRRRRAARRSSAASGARRLIAPPAGAAWRGRRRCATPARSRRPTTDPRRGRRRAAPSVDRRACAAGQSPSDASMRLSARTGDCASGHASSAAW